MKSREKTGAVEQTTHLYEFGGFVLDPRRRLLLRDGRSIHLTSRMLDTLEALVENRGQVMEKDDLLRLVWPDAVVEENNLNQCISALRKALGEAPGENRFIVTLPGRGYRFVAAVKVIERPIVGEGGASSLIAAEKAPPAKQALLVLPASPSREAPKKPSTSGTYRWLWAVALAGVAIVLAGMAYTVQRHRHRDQPVIGRAIEARRAVAVIGFQNLSQRPGQAWLSTSLSEMLMTELGSGGKLRTIPGEVMARAQQDLKLSETNGLSRETLERVRKDLGPDLVVSGAYTVLEGEGGRIRLDLSVQNAITGETITSLSETSPEQDIFALVSRSGTRLRQVLGVEDVSRTETEQAKAAMLSNPEAARLYAEGLAKRRGFDDLGARDTLQKAVAVAPDFPLAHGALADALQDLGYETQAVAEARKALDLSSRLGRENQLLIKARYYRLTTNWDKAIAAYRSLLEFFPDNIDYGLRLSETQRQGGMPQEALATLRELRRLPLPLRDSPLIDLGEAQAEAALANSKEAEAAAQRAGEKARLQGARLLYARALSAQASMSAPDAALDLSEQSRKICVELGDQACVAYNYRRIGNLKVSNDPQGAEQALRQALTIARTIGNKVEESNDLNGLAVLLGNQGNLAGADPMFRQLLQQARERDSKWGIQMSLNNLGEDLLEEGSLSAAKAMEEEALTMSRASGLKIGIASASADLARIRVMQGDLKGAEQYAQTGLEVARAMASPEYIAANLLERAQIKWHQGDLAQARNDYQEALTLWGVKGGYSAPMQLGLSRLALDEGRPDEALSLTRTAAETAQQQRRPDDEARARAVLAEALLAQNLPAQAKTEIDRATILVAHSQAQITRLRVKIAAARVEAALGGYSLPNIQKPMRSLAVAIGEARAKREVALEFEARLARGEIEMRSGQASTGRSSVEAVEKDASGKGFVSIARQAALAKGIQSAAKI